MPLGYGLEGLSARIDCVRVDCWPKAMPLGYGLEGLSARIDCVRVDCWFKVMPLGYGLLGFQPVLIVGGLIVRPR
jgi:hypothetical protein